MFQFWIFGVVISTITTSATFINTKGCVGKCRSSEGYDEVQFLRHKDCDKYCVCAGGISFVYECQHFGEHWSESQEFCTNPMEAKCRALKEENNQAIGTNTDINSESAAQCDNGNCGCIGQCPELEHSSHAVLLAHQDCTKYCHCQNGYPVVKNCSLNYQFNLKNMMCLQQEKAKCDRLNTFTTTVVPPSDEAIKKGCKTKCPKYYNALITHKKCSRYCRCTNGNVVVKFCPRKQHFNAEYAMCISRDQFKCEDSSKNFTLVTSSTSSVIPVTSLPSNTSLSTEFGSSLPTESPCALSTDSNTVLPTELISSTEDMLVEDVSDCIGTCPDVDSYQYLFYINRPHKNCKKYCKCYEGNFTVKECLYDHHFDISFGECISPTFATCYNSDNASTSTPSIPSTISSIIDQTVLPTEPTVTSVTKFLDDTEACIKNFYENYLPNNKTIMKMPHQDCNKYCEYHQGIFKVIECPESAHFDWQFLMCDRTDFARCYITEHEDLLLTTNNPLLQIKSPSSLPSFLNDQSSVNDNNDDKETEIRAEENVEDCIGKCRISDHETYNINLPHKSCEKYCECHKGRPIVKSCSANLHFNQYRSICDQPEIARCQGIQNTNTLKIPSVLPTEPISTKPIVLADGIDGCIGECPPPDYFGVQKIPNYLPHQKCAKYCKCDQGEVTVKLCPVDKYFSRSTKRCVSMEWSGCTNVDDLNPSVTDVSTEGYIIKPTLPTDASSHETSLPIENGISPTNSFTVLVPTYPPELSEGFTIEPTLSTDASSHETSLTIENEVLSTTNSLTVLPSTGPSESYAIPTSIVNTENHPQKYFLNILISLKMAAVENGSEINVFVVDPNNLINTDNDSIKVEVTNSIVNEEVNNDVNNVNNGIDAKEYDDLVPVLANLEDRKECVGTCLKSDESIPIYLQHYECKKTCKCSYGVLTVMECRDQLYWDNEKQKCDHLFNVKCHQIHQRSTPKNVEDTPSIFDQFKTLFNNLGSSSTKLNQDKKR